MPFGHVDTWLQAAAHQHRRRHPGHERQRCDGVDRRGQAEPICNQSRGQRAERVAKVAPETIDAQ